MAETETSHPSTTEIAKVVKRLGTADKLPSVPAVAKEMSTQLSGGFIQAIYEAEAIAFPVLKLPATQKGVADGRKSGLRFERIAARSGLTVPEVRAFAEKAGVADMYVGRGRRPGSGNGSAAASSGRRGAAAAKPAAAKPQGRGTSNRRGAAAAKPAGAKPAAGKRGTRASAADPK